MFVIGDGVPDVTREVMAELTASDERVRFFDNPKGPRHGEIHRHEALKEARGEIVCYLSDDDLWLPGHVEQLRALLADADFAHARPFWIDTEGRPRPWLVDLERPFYRELLLSGENRIPHLLCRPYARALPATAGRLANDAGRNAHRSVHVAADPLGPGLPRGQRLATDRPPLPEPAAERVELDERLVELDSWVERLGDPTLESELEARLLDGLTADAAMLEEPSPTSSSSTRASTLD